uniref:Uncharacterized protein n=1 Tax=Arundo donax TaxID=35708 RepID=A0A0A9DNH5_ARUDO
MLYANCVVLLASNIFWYSVTTARILLGTDIVWIQLFSVDHQ